MSLVKRTVTKTVEVIIFDILTPAACIAVKGREGLREVISRRKERRQKEASENKEEKK